MLSPDEIVSGCVGELYRYRLALQDQLPRIGAATKAPRAERDQIEKDEEELLFAPSMSREAFKEQLESIHDRDIPFLWRLKTEAQFLLSAVYGILTMAKAIRAAGWRRECLRSASDRRLREGRSGRGSPATPARTHRRLHEGRGKDAHRLPDPTEAGGVGMLDEGLVYYVGGELFRLSEIARAADELARAVAACTVSR